MFINSPFLIALFNRLALKLLCLITTLTQLSPPIPRDTPHPLAFFSLVPMNGQASAALKGPENAHLVSKFYRHKAVLDGLDIGLYIGSKSRYTLSTLRRSGDVTVQGSSISRIQCSFELHETSNEIMVHDRSTNKSTRFFGKTAQSFEERRGLRRVLTDSETNLELGFGGATSDLYQFRLVWHDRDDLTTKLNIEKTIPFRPVLR
ncbi:hypothetical protein AK830_g47 [Neonectria ditissima]|uniref:FHA domain-containing protein n=1 Tax=Neonectria ditissima TaxID=78410 RepID=A0A0P7BHN1_9HYPO|nr:hypothetical protein AK830_g47 [Neonectria ditissima]